MGLTSSPSFGASGRVPSTDRSFPLPRYRASLTLACRAELRPPGSAIYTELICLSGGPEHVATRPFQPLWKAAFLRPQPSSGASPFLPTSYTICARLSIFSVDIQNASSYITSIRETEMTGQEGME